MLKNIQTRWKIISHYVLNKFVQKRRCDYQSTCAKCAREILRLLRQFHTQFGDVSIYDLSHEQAREVNSKIYAILNTLHPEGVEPTDSSQALHVHLLFSQSCSRLACLVMEEASIAFQEYNQHEVLSAVEQSVLESLQYILEDLKSVKYSDKTHSASLDAKLDVYELKFNGFGIEYLKKLSQSQTF